MATPEELARLKGNPQTGAVNMPGVDPITPGSFQPGGPPDPGKQIQPAITLPDQQIGSGFNPAPPQAVPGASPSVQPPLQAATAVPNPSAFPGNPPVQTDVAPQEQPVNFDSTPLNPIQKLDADSKSFAKIAEAKRAEGKALSQGKMDEAAIYSQSAQQQELSLGADRQDMLKAKAAAELGEKDLSAKIAKAEAMSVDPDRYWKRKGTANNIMAAIGIGLGSFASGLTGGATGNPALTLINNAIEHDIDAQKSDIDNYWKVIKEQKGLVDNAWNRALVMQNYNANAMLAGYKITESQLKANAAKTDSEVTKAGMERMIAEMQPTMDSYRAQTWSTLAALEAEKRKQQMAGQAAAAAQRNAAADKRNAMVKDLVTSQIAQGVDPDQAMQAALKQTDALFPQLKGTQFASPGQQYDALADKTQSHYMQLQQGLNDKNPAVKSKTQDLYLKALMDAGLPYEDALKQMKTLQNASPAQLATQARLDLNQDGIVSPYEASKSTSTGTTEAIDPLSGQTVRVTPKTKELAVRGPDDKVYLMADSSIANEWRKSEAMASRARSATDTLMDLAKLHPGGDIGDFSPDDLRRFKEAQGLLTSYYGAQGNSGTMGAGDVVRFQQMVADPFKIVTLGDANKQAQSMKDGIDKSRTNTFQGLSGAKGASAPTAPKPATNTSGDPFTGAGGKSDPFTPINPVDTDKQNAGKRNY